MIKFQYIIFKEVDNFYVFEPTEVKNLSEKVIEITAIDYASIL